MKSYLLLSDQSLRRIEKASSKVVLREVRELLQEAKRAVTQATAVSTPLTWHDMIEPISYAHDRLERAWGRVHHLVAVADAPARREINQRGTPLLTEYNAWFNQHPKLSQRIKQLRQQRSLSAMQKRVLDLWIRDFTQAGAYLSKSEQVKVKTIHLKLSAASTKFSERLLDATKAGIIHITDAKQIKGISASVVQLAQTRAKQKKQPGWIFSIQNPEYGSVMRTAADRGLRQTLYRISIRRASELGPAKWNNAPMMTTILKQRQQLGRILGYQSYAELSLSRKMAAKPKTVERFLHQLVKRTLPRAKKEFQQLQVFARQKFGYDVLRPWDIEYVSEQYRIAKVGLGQEDTRAYFPLSVTFRVLCQVAEKTFGVRIVPNRKQKMYDPNVQAFFIQTPAGKLLGQLMLDLSGRPTKRSGAWENADTSRATFGTMQQLPVAYIAADFPKPVRGEVYLSHSEVDTLFHEFGHAWHTLLTQINVPEISGTNGVEWDAVELPSQWFESFAWEPWVLQAIARQLGQKGMPVRMQRQLLDSRKFLMGLWLLRQLNLGLFDLTLHQVRHYDAKTTTKQWFKIVRTYSVTPFTSDNRFASSFQHIFAGGYAAGYYGYLWAEVMAADAFAPLHGNVSAWKKWGTQFRNQILANGGSEPAGKLYQRYRGRKPKITALLQRYGI